MVKEYEAPIRTYPYPFELVMEAYHKRYPKCDLIPEMLESVVTYDFVSEDKSLIVTERRFKMSIEAPYLLKKICGVDHFYCIGRNSLNRVDRTLLIESRNETFSTNVSAFETCKFSASPNNSDHTIFEQKACLEMKHFYGFESLAEKVCIKAYTKSFNKLLQRDGITHVPRFIISDQKPATSTKIPIQEISYRNPLTIRKYLSTLSLVESNSILLIYKKFRQRPDEYHEQIPNLSAILRFLRAAEGDCNKVFGFIYNFFWHTNQSLNI
ncbi:hypothetical protein MXB_4136 [Myxobolus squamalis]|nr:hypothetical protein MXB_4136 [Myxobolus squamalis]